MERIFLSDEQIVAAQEEILRKGGLWSTPELKSKYAFRLSPDALEILSDERKDLEELSFLLYAPGGFFDGAMRLYQKSLDPRFTSTPVGSIVRRGLTNGIPKRELAIQGIFPEPPVLSRVDLIKTQNGDSSSKRFQIAEIEGDKTHGFGYLTLMDFFRREFMGSEDTIGIINTLKRSLLAKGLDPQTSIIAIVGRSERFYEGEQRVFSEFCRANGLNLFTVPESEVATTDRGVVARGVPESNVLLNLPTLTSSGYMDTGVDEEKVFELLKQGSITCLIPPNRFLGSKGLLALISNGDNNPGLEEVLQDAFNSEVLDELRSHIPQTILITKKISESLLIYYLESQTSG